jgi:hypothetical protein
MPPNSIAVIKCAGSMTCVPTGQIQGGMDRLQFECSRKKRGIFGSGAPIVRCGGSRSRGRLGALARVDARLDVTPLNLRESDQIRTQ